MEYDVLADIPEGGRGSPNGIYGDFVRIEYQSKKGFIEKSALDYLPLMFISKIPQEDLPPITINLFDYVYNSQTISTNNGVVIDQLNGTEGCAYEIKSSPITTPFSIQINMQQEGNLGMVQLTGRLQKPNDEWWVGRRTLYIEANGVININNGTADHPIYRREIPEIAMVPFSIFFPDPNGKIAIFRSLSGDNLVTINFSEIPELGFTDGVFPDGFFYFGVLVFPGTKFTIHQFNLVLPPDGVFR